MKRVLREWGRRAVVLLISFVASPAMAQGNRDTRAPDTTTSPKVTPPAAPTAKPSPKPAPKPPSEWERASALLKKRQFDQACPIFEKLALAAPNNGAAWLDYGQCETHRGRKSVAIEATQHAVSAGDRVQRLAAYQLLRSLNWHLELPANGCDWLDETPGICSEQMWSCSYSWEHSRSELSRSAGRSNTFGLADEELTELDEALSNKSALRERLAMEWKALPAERADETVCSACHTKAVESADSLVNARASTCFQQRTGRAPPNDICVHASPECDTFSLCLDEAAELARRSEGAGRNLWPEASEVIAAAHKVCDATCGIVARTRCDVLTVDACRGFVGYSCVRTERGKRPRITFGEIDVNDAKGNWSEQQPPPPPPPRTPTPSPTPTPPALDASKKAP